MLNLDFDVTLGSFRAAVKLTSESGETTVILGESGSGKTTVLRVLAGLLSPQHGSFVLNEEVYLDTATRIEVPAQDRPVGYVFQDYALFPHLSVYDNIAFGLKMQRVAKKQIRQRVAQALAQAHLVGYDDRRPRELSGGQQQRVAIARALALRPRLLLLDESLSALDIQTRRQVVRELRDILSELQLTTVMVSHQYSDALNLAHHIMVLEGGRVIQEGTHLDLLRHPKSSYIAEMTGVNRFEGSIVRYDPDSGSCRFALAGDQETRLEIEGSDGLGPRPRERLAVGDRAIAVIHPRHVKLSIHPPTALSHAPISCVVSQVTPVSASLSAKNDRMEGLVRVVMVIDPRLPTLTADITVDPAIDLPYPYSEGTTVYATVEPGDVTVFPDEPARQVAEPPESSPQIAQTVTG
jgi:molybdate transport system ATP-binding protein